MLVDWKKILAYSIDDCQGYLRHLEMQDKLRNNIELLSENNQMICTQEFLDEPEYAQEFNVKKPKESVVLKIEIPVQDFI